MYKNIIMSICKYDQKEKYYTTKKCTIVFYKKIL